MARSYSIVERIHSDSTRSDGSQTDGNHSAGSHSDSTRFEGTLVASNHSGGSQWEVQHLGHRQGWALRSFGAWGMPFSSL